MEMSIQLFCRSVVLFVFLLSFASKARHMALFQQTIVNFALLPRGLARAAAWLFLFAEAMVVFLVTVGKFCLLPGYLLASVLLLLFSLALLSVLLRHISTTCACFGPSNKAVSTIDLVRNAGFLICASGACLTLLEPAQGGPDLSTWIPGVLGALIFVGVWTQLGEIVQLFL